MGSTKNFQDVFLLEIIDKLIIAYKKKKKLYKGSMVIYKACQTQKYYKRVQDDDIV